MKTCETCEYYYEEHCVNGSSDYCTEPVSEDDGCGDWEEVRNEKDSSTISITA